MFKVKFAEKISFCQQTWHVACGVAILYGCNIICAETVKFFKQNLKCNTEQFSDMKGCGAIYLRNCL